MLDVLRCIVQVGLVETADLAVPVVDGGRIRLGVGIPSSGRNRRRGSKSASPRNSLEWALASITDSAAVVSDQRQNIVRIQRPWKGFIPPLIGDAGRVPNFAPFQFLDPAAHDFYPD